MRAHTVFASRSAAAALLMALLTVACQGAPGKACKDPTRILLDGGSWSGFERCADGAVNRVADVTVTSPVVGGECRGDEDQLDCTADDECEDGTACVHQVALGEGPISSLCSCRPICTSDADCAEGFACVPPGVLDAPAPVPPSTFATCVPAKCRTGDDCDSGECGTWAYDADACGTERGLECRSRHDECRTQDDCPGRGSCAANDGNGRWFDAFTCDGMVSCEAR